MGIGVLMRGLAWNTAYGCRISQKAYKRDVGAAAGTVPIPARIDALKRRLYVAHLGNLTVDHGRIQIGQHIRYRCIAQIGHAARQIDIMLLA